MKTNKKWIKRIVWIAVIVIIGAAIAGSLLNAKKPEYTSETVKTRDLETFYTFSGNIEPDDTKLLLATGNGKVKTVYPKEGDSVLDEAKVIKMASGSTYESPIDGTVTDIYVEQDDTVFAGDQLARIATYNKPVVIISIDEYDISAVKLNEGVKVYIQAMDKTVDGVITKIDSEATVNGNVAYYNATVAIEQDGSIMMGMTCEVSIPKESALNATTIALSSVKFDENNKPFIYCYDRYDEVISEYITLGVNNGTYVEVTEGLKVGDTILIPKNGMAMFMAFPGGRNR